jgi:hypothetical protein
LINLDKSKKYSIVGVPKCGTSSLGEYMRRMGYDVTEDELYFADKTCYPNSDRKPLIILRDPVERAWSDFNFFHGDHETLEEACEWSRYEKYLKNWPDAVIFQLEELQKLEEFPHHNHNIHKPELDNDTRKKIEVLLS